MLNKLVTTPLAELLAFLNQFDDFIWLDSADDKGPSLLACEASKQARFNANDAKESFLSFLDEISAQKSQNTPDTLKNFFAGGWVGYLCYEAYVFNKLIPFKPSHTKNHPVAQFQHHNYFFIIHPDKSIHFYHHENDHKALAFWKKWTDFKNSRKQTSFSKNPSHLDCKIQQETYQQSFEQVRKSLEQGDYFELNLTMAFELQSDWSDFETYTRLRTQARAPMMFFGRFDSLSLLSGSPERFFKISNNTIKTYPIKGTRARDFQNDQVAIKELQASEKDRAELLMVTDLLRNDLGRICEFGSVKTSALFDVISFPQYHHLVSCVEGQLKSKTKLSEIFEALFPGGSITGAPKIEVMKHIDRLENRARGIYTGMIGYVSQNGVIDFNIPIRTLVFEDDKKEFCTGSGLVIDSDLEAEWQECQLKALALKQAIED